MKKHITIENFILTISAGFAAYNFGLVGGYIEHGEGAHFSWGGLAAGVVVNISLAIAASKYGSLKGEKRTRQAQNAFIAMMILSPILVSPVIYYSLPETFLGFWWLRAAWSIAWPLVADLAIVLAGAVSGKGLIALSEPGAAQSDAPAGAGAQGTEGSAAKKKRTADALRSECAAHAAHYACTVPQCGWSADVDALIASAGAGRSPKSAASSAKAGHMKNRHPKRIEIDQSLLLKKKDGNER